MSRNRMFGDDPVETAESGDPEQIASPRTTIVGGRPPDDGAQQIPVPTGIQSLLRLASLDEQLRQELLTKRSEVAQACGVNLTSSEQAILAAIPGEHLVAMAESLPPPAVERRDFLRKTAATAVVLLGGATLSDCTSDSKSPAEPVPPRPDRRDFELEGGASPRVDERAMLEKGGAKPDLPPPRVEIRETAVVGGAAPDEPPPRPDRVPSPPGGARPDLPPPKPDGGADGGSDGGFAEPPEGWDGGTPPEPVPEPTPVRPIDKRPTRGIRFDVPRKPKK